MKLLIINGPNLNLLGKREPEIYGKTRFEDFLAELRKKYGSEIDLFQTNIEGEIINKLHRAEEENYSGIILNAGAYTHYSYAIHDAIKSISIPVVEVHISNIFAREEFRQKSVIAPACIGSISGFGLQSYELAIHYFLISNRKVHGTT